MTKILLLISFFCVTQTSTAQEFLGKKGFIEPGLSVGYTFHAGLNYGLVLDAGLVDNKTTTSLKYGLSFSYYFVTLKVRGKNHVHRLRSTSVMLENNFFDVKVGWGRARNKWGYGQHNRCIVHGPTADVSFAYPNRYSPWIGYKTFRYNNYDWAWFFKPYNSVYIKYRYGT